MFHLLNLLLQEEIPDTSQYMIAGYAVIFGLMAIYLLSLYLRHRALQRSQNSLDPSIKEDFSPNSEK